MQGTRICPTGNRNRIVASTFQPPHHHDFHHASSSGGSAEHRPLQMPGAYNRHTLTAPQSSPCDNARCLAPLHQPAPSNLVTALAVSCTMAPKLAPTSSPPAALLTKYQQTSKDTPASKHSSTVVLSKKNLRTIGPAAGLCPTNKTNRHDLSLASRKRQSSMILAVIPPSAC